MTMFVDRPNHHHAIVRRSRTAQVVTASIEDGVPTFRRSVVAIGQGASVDDILVALDSAPAVPVPFSEGISTFDLASEEGRGLRPSLAAHVDPRAVGALGCIGTYTTAAHAYYAGDGALAESRRTAAAVYPYFAGEIAGSFPLRLCVDRDQPLAPLLQRRFGLNEDTNAPIVSKGLVKRFNGRRLPDRDVPIGTVMAFLSRIPVDLFPEDDVQWDSFLTIVEGLGSRVESSLGIDVVALLDVKRGGWADLVSRICHASADRRDPDPKDHPEIVEAKGRVTWKDLVNVSRESFMNACNGLVDMVHAFRDQVFLPVVGQAAIDRRPFVSQEWIAQATPAAFDILLGGKRLTAMFEAQCFWHTQAHGIDYVVEQLRSSEQTVEIGSEGFRPLCNQVTAPNGIEIWPLVTPSELAAEGAAMNHCVGGMSDRCRNNTYILSFRRREPSGKLVSLSTARYEVKGDFDVLDRQEHRGRSNKSVSDGCREAREWFEHQVEVGVIPLNADGVMEYEVGGLSSIEDIESSCGYDWRSLEKVALVHAAWLPFMPGESIPEIEAFVASPEIQAFAEELVPSFGRFEAALAPSAPAFR